MIRDMWDHTETTQNNNNNNNNSFLNTSQELYIISIETTLVWITFGKLTLIEE